MSNKIQVRLQDSTIGVLDKFIVGKYEYETQSQAESVLKQQVIDGIDDWLKSNTDTDYYYLKNFTDALCKIDKAEVLKLVELLTQLT